METFTLEPTAKESLMDMENITGKMAQSTRVYYQLKMVR